MKLLCETCKQELPVDRAGCCDECIAAENAIYDAEQERIANARFDFIATTLRELYPTRIPEEWLK